MLDILRHSFAMQGLDNKEILDRLLAIHGYSIASYSDRMGIESSELDNAPMWAIMSLADSLDGYLNHLGYIAKDKTIGWVFDKFSDLELLYQQNGGTQPITINIDSVTDKNVGIDLAMLVNIQGIMENK